MTDNYNDDYGDDYNFDTDEGSADEYMTADDAAQAELAALRKQIAAMDARLQPPSVHGGQPYEGPVAADHEVSADSLFGLSEVTPSKKFSAKDIAETDELGNKRTPESRWAEAWNRVTGGQQPRSQGGA